MEKDTAYTQRFNKHLQERYPDLSTRWRNDYSVEALAVNRNRARPKTQQPARRIRGINVSLPAPLVGQLIPSVFASAGMMGCMPSTLVYIPTKGMIPAKDGKGFEILGTPAHTTGPDVRGIPVHVSVPDVRGVPIHRRGPEVSGIPAARATERGPQVETFPGRSDRARSAEPTILMSKNGDNGQRGDRKGLPPLGQQYHQAPKTLPAFPEAQKADRKTPVQGGGKLRERWKDDKHIYEWDSKKGAIEKYNRTGKIHLGEFDPATGQQTGDPDPARKVEP